MAPYGAVVFSIAARPAFDDGTVQDWADYLAAQNNVSVEGVREARVNGEGKLVRGGKPEDD